MTIGIMQPYFMPYIGYFQLIKAVDRFVILDDVNFITRGWANRNQIIVNGAKHRFSIRLCCQSQNRLFNEIVIADDFHRFFETLRHSYGKAPYYTPTIEMLKSICSSTTLFSDFATNALKSICHHLSIDTEILISSQIDKDNNLRQSKRIIDICRRLNADAYINPIGGQELYDKDDFSRHNIKLKFIKPEFTPYPQINSSQFIAGLSIIDILMNCDKHQINELLNNYTLIEA